MHVASDGVGAQTPAYFGGGCKAQESFPFADSECDTTSEEINMSCGDDEKLMDEIAHTEFTRGATVPEL